MKLIQIALLGSAILPVWVMAELPVTEVQKPAAEITQTETKVADEKGQVSGQKENQAAQQQTTPEKAGQETSNKINGQTAGQKEAEDASTLKAQATPVVEKLNNTLLEVMKRAKELGYQGRYELLEPVVREVYDFKAISKYVLGKHWDSLVPEQKKNFIEKLTQYGIAAYASQFNDYSGEQFKILGEEPFRGRFRVVKSILEVPDDENVNFVYILRKTGDSWKIIDVRYDGVSDLALKRSQFTEILGKKGFDGLLAKLDEKIANYAKGKNKPENKG